VPEKDDQRQLEENLALLSIVHRFAFDNVVRFVLQRIVPAKIPIARRIRFGDKYDFDKWLFSAYEELLDRKDSLNVDELDALGPDRVIRFIRARDFMHQERLDAERTDVISGDTGIFMAPGQSCKFLQGWPAPASRIPKSTAQVATDYFTAVKAYAE
jgi:hypothetical protein